MQMIDKERVSREVSMLSPYVKTRCWEVVDFNKRLEKELIHVKHKRALEMFEQRYNEYVQTRKEMNNG
jgi:hypothetical protein